MSVREENLHFDTLKVKAGYDPKQHNNAVSVSLPRHHQRTDGSIIRHRALGVRRLLCFAINFENIHYTY